MYFKYEFQVIAKYGMKTRKHVTQCSHLRIQLSVNTEVKQGAK